MCDVRVCDCVVVVPVCGVCVCVQELFSAKYPTLLRSTCSR